MWSDAGRRSLLKVGGCTILCTVQWLWRGACSTAGAAGDHVVSPFAATCRAPAVVLLREAQHGPRIHRPRSGPGLWLA